jgi:hypothetical protein
MAACAKMAFPACVGPLITALGAFDEQRKFVLRLSEKRPPRPFQPYFKSAKLLPFSPGCRGMIAIPPLQDILLQTNHFSY